MRSINGDEQLAPEEEALAHRRLRNPLVPNLGRDVRVSGFDRVDADLLRRSGE